MARPKGSTNKPKTVNNVQVLKFEKQIEGTSINRDSSQGWIKWGTDNLYCNHLLDLYAQSPTHHAAINFEVQSIVAGGIDYEAMKIDGTQIVPNYAYDWGYLLRAIALDYALFGSYAIEIILNKDRKTYSFWQISIDKVRVSPYDEDGQITSYWVSSDWSSTGQYPPIKIDAFDMREDSKIEYGKPYLYVYRPYDPLMQYYQAPAYIAALNSIKAEIEYCNYDLKHIINGFSAAGVLTLPEMETDEQRRTIINNIQGMFQGSSNANTIAIAFRNNIEDKPVEFTPFQQVSNVNTYADSNQRTINRILTAHQIVSPMLVGLPDSSNAGFSSDADKIETAYQLYQKLVGNYNRECIVKTFNQMLKINGIDVELVLKPLYFNDFGDKNDVSSDTNATDTNQNVSTENIEEKVEN